MSHVFIGVDPGFGGAIAFLEDVEGEEDASVVDMPTRRTQTPTRKPRIDRGVLRNTIMDHLYIYSQLVAVVEAVGAMGGKGRKEGASSMFRFGQGQGEVLGLLTGIGAQVFEVHPATWKGKCGLIGMNEREVCKRAAALWPDQVLFGPRGGPLHGRAEALFLAAYARMLAEGRAIHER